MPYIDTKCRPIVHNVLVVDNDPAVLTFMRMFLQKEGFAVRTANDGLEALSVLEDYEPDVVFIDLIMPKIPGQKLCRILRAQKRYDQVYLIVLSAISAEEEVDYVEDGFDACIAKGPLKTLGGYVLDVLHKLGTEITRTKPGSIYGLESLYKREITRELLSTKRHFELILGNMSECIVETTDDGRIVFANPAALDLLGVSEADLLGTNVAHVFTDGQRARVQDVFGRMGSRSVVIGEDDPLHFHGHVLTVQLHPVADDETRSVIIIMNDITERRRSEVELRKAHAELEDRVARRTSELASANESLRREIDQRTVLEGRLRSSLDEKVTLLNEIHHRVKNNLQVVSSLLGIFTQRIDNEELSLTVREIRARIHSIAMVHEKLYRSTDLSAVDIGDYVRSFVDYLVRSYSPAPGAIRAQVDAETVHIGLDLAVPCALIVNELVTNSLKHAFPDGREGRIDIRIAAPAPGGFRMEIADDGVGLRDEVDVDTPETAGLRVVKVLVGQLGGSMRLKNGRGTQYVVEVPIGSPGGTE